VKLRLKIFLILNLLFILIWVSYLYIVQILDPFDFSKTLEVRKNPAKKLLYPYRGNIYDRNNKLIVSSAKYYQLDIDKHSIVQYCKKHKDLTENSVYNKIAEIVSKNSDLTNEFVLNKLTKTSPNAGIYLSENITEAQLINIRNEFAKQKIKGLIKNFSSIKRSYPYNKLAASLLGIVEKQTQSDNNVAEKSIFRLEGKCGLEATYDDILQGEFGWEERIHDAKNTNIPHLFLRDKEPVNGNSLVLTIDISFQEILEESLRSGISKYDAKMAMGIIMDVNSGDIMAMSGIGKKDKKRYASTLRAMQNLPVSFMFEPGSVMKPISALLAIESGIIDAEEKIDCRDYHLEYNETKRIIKDSHEHKYLNMKDIIAYSSNVGISKIVEEVGSRNLYNRMLDLGFGHKTGSNLHGEASGIFRKLEDWQGFSLHSISFGQELSVTALQLAGAYCTLANGGNVLEPHILKEVRNEDFEVTKKILPKVLRKVSDKKSLNTLKEYLQSVVEYGTATAAKMPNLSIAGKTGTAEKLIRGESAYSKDKYTSVFAGFFPVESPKYAMVIVFDEPRYNDFSYYASMSAVPTFKDVVSKLINLPENNFLDDIKEENTDFITMPKVVGLSKEKAQNLLKKKNINYNILGTGNLGIVQNQYPKPNVSFDSQQTVTIIIDDISKNEEEKVLPLDYKMPHLVGLTVREAVEKAMSKSIKLKIIGKGIVISQSIAQGTATKYGEQCVIQAKLQSR
jgi:cell division protein FtsI/penicillin-binding protein 2